MRSEVSGRMKRILCAVLLVMLLVIPGLGLTEGDDTIQLARTLYTLGRDESYDTLLLIGTVVMNRVDNPWYPDTVSEVLGEPHQFPRGMKYDERALQAARDVMMGKRTAPKSVIGYCALDAAVQPDQEYLYETSGTYGFYYGDR